MNFDSGTNPLVKHLFLYRHADTLPADHGQSDHDRILSPRGEEESRRVGAFLQLNDVRPAFALCSTAVRTRQTLAITLDTLGQDLPVRYENALYLASAGDIFHLAAGLDDAVNEAIIVAHNPGIHLFCQILAKSGDRTGRNEIAARFPPATLALFRLPVTHWAELSPETDGELQGVAIPKQSA